MLKSFILSLRSQKLRWISQYRGESRDKCRTIYLQVLGNGARGSGPSVYLFSDRTRYLFNCGEGTQRLANEYRTNLSMVENIFLTKNTWDRSGGTAGMCLTLQDFKCEKVNIHGPPGIDKMFRAARKFLRTTNLEVSVPKCEEGDMFEDSVMSVRYVPLQRDVEQAATEIAANCVMAYICKTREQRGDFSFEKCIEMGVETSDLVLSLKNGDDVSLPDGTIVKSCDVLCPGDSSAVFIFIDIPDETFFASLIESEALKAYGSKSVKKDDIAKIVVHFSSEEIVKNPIYQKWLSEFCSSTTHWFVNDRNTFSGQSAPHLMQHQLNLIDDNVFPLLSEIHPSSRGIPDQSKELRIMDIFSIRNRNEQNLPQHSIPDIFADQATMSDEILELIKKYKSKVVLRNKEARSKEFPKICTLGTGSGMPSKTRNDAANLIHITDDNCVLLDCGEGTLGQLVRFYGHEATDKILKNLRVIFISHLHADHHLGLIHILNQRQKLTEKKILLLAPAPIMPWLTFYNFGIEDIFSTVDFISCTDLFGWHIEENVKKELCNRLGLTDIETCYARHCSNSFCISLEMTNSMQCKEFPNENLKITYSGDTAPSNELVNIGMNSSVLIHEATMEDGLEEDAHYKKHSTISQAIDDGRKMNANFVILTHFSNRYAKIPFMQKNQVENVAISFDNMEVSLRDLPTMHLMFEPLMAMFRKQIDQLERKVTNRKHKEERETRLLQSMKMKAQKLQKLNDSSI